MDKKLITDFLIKSTIPAQKKYPKFVNEDNKRLWDAVYRAHRDVLTGRAWLPKYCNGFGSAQNNEILKFFFELLCKHECNSSIEYIENIELKYDVEFGAIQKLVNMTLKYIIIYNELSEYNFPIEEDKCDCPIDSIILSKLDNKHTPWTRMEKGEYLEVQEEIKDGLVFDFINW